MQATSISHPSSTGKCDCKDETHKHPMPCRAPATIDYIMDLDLGPILDHRESELCRPCWLTLTLVDELLRIPQREGTRHVICAIEREVGNGNVPLVP